MSTDPAGASRHPAATDEYWIGYHQGKAAAMRNIGVIQRTHPAGRRHPTDRGYRLTALYDTMILAAGLWLIWPGTLDHPSVWIHLVVGFVFGSWSGHTALWWLRR